MHIKSAPVQIKAAGTQDGTDEGVFEAIVSAFNNVDSYGDVVIPGAFAETLAEWAASGDPIPVLWSHASNDPDYHIGWVLSAEERPEGLWVRAQIDPDDLADPKSKANKIYRLLKGRRVTQFSFAFDVLDGGWGDRDGREVYELRKLKLYEVGPTLIGVNQQTDLLDVKHRDGADKSKTQKPSGANGQSQVDETEGAKSLDKIEDTPSTQDVLTALNELKALLSAKTPHDDTTATPTQPATTTQPPQVASDGVPARSGTASARLRADLSALEADVISLTT